MDGWFIKLFTDVGSVAHIAMLIGLVAACGLALGSLRFRGISLGIGGVLFAGLAGGHFVGSYLNHHESRLAIVAAEGARPDSTPEQKTAASDASKELKDLPARIETQKHIMEFVREFGLILFVYTIGVQVGPGFVASLRRQGLPLNLMAAAIVILGTLTAVGLGKLCHMQVPEIVGMLSGATTNTPSLAAGQEAIKDRSRARGEQDQLTRRQSSATSAYAIAYPFGIIGIIGTMVIIRFAFKLDPQREAEALAALSPTSQKPVTTMNLEVTNPNLAGLPLRRIPGLKETGVTISRVGHGGAIAVADGDTVVKHGDVLLAVGIEENLDQLRLIVGRKSEVDLRKVPSNIATKRIIVTKSAALGKTVAELDLHERFGVTVTRINRAEVELPAAGVDLQFGDNLVVVGDPESIKAVGKELGDSVKQLNHPQVIPVFVGIVLGVILGSWAIPLPGMPAPVKLGLAGGPLVVAIILSRLGHLGPLVWYMPISANFMLREVGIVMFLAAVGLISGDSFLATLRTQGLMWMGLAALVTFIPLLIVGFVGRLVYKVNYLTLCGLLAGSMTDPPALAFASSVTGSDAPSISYATVYPLVMLLRVLIGQMLVLMMM